MTKDLRAAAEEALDLIDCTAKELASRGRSWADEKRVGDKLRTALAQPDGGEVEPAHFRAVLDPEQVPQQLKMSMHVVGFRDKKAADAFVVEQLDFYGWRYSLEPLYTHPPLPAQAVPEWQPTDQELTAIYKAATGEDKGKPQPLTTSNIFKAMRAMIAAAPPLPKG